MCQPLIPAVAEFYVFDDNDQEYLVTIPYNWSPSVPASRDSWGCPLEPDDDGGSLFYKDEDVAIFSITDGKHTKLDKDQHAPILELAYDPFLGLNDTYDLIWSWHDNNDIYAYNDNPEPEYAER